MNVCQIANWNETKSMRKRIDIDFERVSIVCVFVKCDCPVIAY